MQEVINILDKLRQLSGNDQIEELSKHKDNQLLREILTYTYDTSKKFKINEKKFNARYELAETHWDKSASLYGKQHHWDNFKNFLDKFYQQKAVTFDQIDEFIFTFWSYLDDDTLELFKGVLFKDLRLGLNISTINKAFGEKVLEKEYVTLAENYKGKMPKGALISRKVDGKRGYRKGVWFYSRTNKQFKSEPIAHIKEQLESIDPNYEFVFDGEMAYFDSNWNENFKKAQSLLSSDKRTSECDDLYFMIFDRVPANYFEDRISTTKLSDNYHALIDQFEATHIFVDGLHTGLMRTKCPNVLIAKQTTEEYFPQLLERSKQLKWEGLIIRADVPYEYKRSTNFLRIKQMKDAEFKIVRFNKGGARTKYADTLGSITVELSNGDQVDVGSGYSDQQRENIWKAQEKILSQGLYAKVQYFQETTDKKGKHSLRFPVFICFRDIMTSEEFMF